MARAARASRSRFDEAAARQGPHLNPTDAAGQARVPPRPRGAIITTSRVVVDATAPAPM